MTRDVGSISSAGLSEQNAVIESRLNYRPTENVACNATPPGGAITRSHLHNMMTSSPASPLFTVYTEALAWLRQLHAMCACADTPFPLPLPPMTSPEPPYYVTKMAGGVPPMQPFDPRWASCPSPSTAPCVDPPAAREPPSRGGRGRDFSIPSILSHAGSSSTEADSDGTAESDERCQSTSSSLDDVCGSEQRHVVTSQRHVMTSYDNAQRAHVDLTTGQRRRQCDKQQFECPQCNKVRVEAECTAVQF